MFNINEVNIFENGFLNEFNNASSNQNICLNVDPTDCLIAEKAAGIAAGTATKPVADFANLGLAGQVAVPVLTAAFTGSKTGSQTASSFFTNSTFTTDITNHGAGSFASSLGTGSQGFTTFTGNLVAAGFPLNYFIVNPAASSGAFAYANAFQSTFNALIVDLRHRPSHGSGSST